MNVVPQINPKVNVLLIEDDDQHAKIIHRYIRNYSSINLIRKSKLSDGIDYILNDGIEVILLDLMLPDSRGEDTLLAVLKQFYDLPIIILSSLSDRKYAEKLIKIGAQDYLCKAYLSEEGLLRSISYARQRKYVSETLKKDLVYKNIQNEISKLGISQNSFATFMRKASQLILDKISPEAVLSVYEYKCDERLFYKVFQSGSPIGIELNNSIPKDNVFPFEFRTDRFNDEQLFSNDKDIDFSGGVDGSTHKRILVDSFFDSKESYSGLAFSVYGNSEDEPYGIMTIFSKKNNYFTELDVYFLKAVANIIATTIKRFSLEDKQKEYVRDLELAHQRKDQFLSILSHELRTPLTAITGFTELLMLYPKKSSEFKKSIIGIKKNAAVELRLIDDILEMSRIIKGRFKLQLTKINFKDMIHDSIKAVEFSAHAKKIKITTQLETNLPIITCDKIRLQQMVWNLLTNAIKFTNELGNIELQVFRLKENIYIKIQDDGIGIDSRDIPLIFDKFWQSDNTDSREYNGLGLGLSIVKHIVQAHGGQIKCKSDGKNKGTTFEIFIPIVSNFDVSEDPVLKNETLEIKNDGIKGRNVLSSPLNSLNILIVEDTSDTLYLFKKFLEMSGANVVAFEDPEQALTYFKSNAKSFDLIVSDIGLPKMNGHQLIEEIKKINDGIPAIALSAFASEKDRNESLSRGFNLHLSKPITRKKLISEIEKVIYEEF